MRARHCSCWSPGLTGRSERTRLLATLLDGGFAGDGSQQNPRQHAPMCFVLSFHQRGAGLQSSHSDAFAGELVGAFVLDVAGVALDPVPATLCGFRAASRRCHRSTFLTGFLSAVRQPFFFQPWIHSVMPCRTYWRRCRDRPRTGASAPPAPRSPPSAPCGCWWCAPRRPTVPFDVAEHQDRAPAAGPGIARAGAVGVRSRRPAFELKPPSRGASRRSRAAGDAAMEAQLAEIFHRVLRLHQRVRRALSQSKPRQQEAQRRAARQQRQRLALGVRQGARG